MSMAPTDLKIALIVASVRPDRFGPVVANWMQERVHDHDVMELDVIDLADFDLPVGLDGSGDTARLGARVDAADAFVLVTPEYNHGYPGYLKIAIDAFVEEWRAKPLGFVSYGGGAGGSRAVEQLRPVFGELQVVTIRESVLFPGVWASFHEEGHLLEPEGQDAAAASMLDQLAWWGHTLRTARGSDVEA